MTKPIMMKTKARTEFINITADVQKIVRESGIKDGICIVYCPHTTAAITINEGADPAVAVDIISTLNREFPHEGSYRHSEGNSDAHIKTSLVNPSQTIIVEQGSLLLGTWQAIFLCEFDGARNRRVLVKVLEG
jgi:secondary thiamine-phosphate synthase enzyme